MTHSGNNLWAECTKRRTNTAVRNKSVSSDCLTVYNCTVLHVTTQYQINKMVTKMKTDYITMCRIQYFRYSKCLDVQQKL